MMKDGKLFREVEQNCWSPETRINEMDATGKIYIKDILNIIGWISGSCV